MQMEVRWRDYSTPYCYSFKTRDAIEIYTAVKCSSGECDNEDTSGLLNIACVSSAWARNSRYDQQQNTNTVTQNVRQFHRVYLGRMGLEGDLVNRQS